MQTQFTSTANQIANREFVNRGISPWPCLTLAQSRRLIELVEKSSLTEKEQSELSRLKAKVEG